MKGIALILILSAITINSIAQKGISYPKIYGLALNAKADQILQILDTSTVVTKEDSLFKQQFESRFRYNNDTSSNLKNEHALLNPLYSIYKHYWQEAMSKKGYSTRRFKRELCQFYRSQNRKQKFTSVRITRSTLDTCTKAYIQHLGYLTTGFGITGNLFDLLVWKTSTDTTYRIALVDDTVNVTVRMMDGFAILGWEEYATFGKYYPGGWATKELLFCVKKSYNTNSENFKVSYLCHEGQHFSDYKRFPNLSATELEYRAKLVELSLANETLIKTVRFFINNASKDATNPHPYANYQAIENLSQSAFRKPFEGRILEWEKLPKTSINQKARELLLEHTLMLLKTNSTPPSTTTLSEGYRP